MDIIKGGSLWLCPCVCRFISKDSFTSVHIWQLTCKDFFCTVKVQGQTSDWKLAQTGWMYSETSERCQQGLFFSFNQTPGWHLWHGVMIEPLYSVTRFFTPSSFQISFQVFFFKNNFSFRNCASYYIKWEKKKKKKNLFSLYVQKTVVFFRPAADLHRGVSGGRGVLKRSCQYIFASVRQQSGVIALKGAGLKLLFYKY